MRLIQWLLSDDTGMSSCAIVAHMTGCNYECMAEPADPSDLGRCLRLLRLVPEFEGRIGEMACYSDRWKALTDNWADLKSAMTSEVGLDWEKGRSAPATAVLMRELVN